MNVNPELLAKTREKAYVTLVKLCDDFQTPPEVKLQAAAMLLQATERDEWVDELPDADAEAEAEEGEPLAVRG